MNKESTFSQEACREILTIIAHQSKPVSTDLLNIFEQYEKSAGRKAIAEKLSHPENWIFYILVFLNLQILKNKYPNKGYDKTFLKTARKQLGFLSRWIMRGEIKRYDKMFADSLNDGINPMEKIIRYFYETTTKRNADILISLKASTYLTELSSVCNIPVTIRVYNLSDKISSPKRLTARRCAEL